MGSTGQIIGFVGGAVIGALLAGPLGFAGAGIITAMMMGGSLGSIAGGLIDPPRIGNQEAQHEIREVLYNTFAQDLPVPILYGRRRITGNIIFVGDTYGKVEDVGDQKVGQGKSEQEVDIFKVVYYADFIIGLGEGPFQEFTKTLQDEVDISEDEGELYTMRYGTPDEPIDEIVLNSPNPVLHPVGYSNTAQLVWTGKIGEINHIPSIEVECIGPNLEKVVTGTPVGLPTSISHVMFDDLSDLVICQTSTTQLRSFKRDGSDQKTTTIPTGYTIDRAFYLGRWDTLIVFTGVSYGMRWLLYGHLGIDGESAEWEVVPMTSQAAQSQIKHAFVEDGTGHVYTFYIVSSGVVMVKTALDHSQSERAIGIAPSNLLIRGVYYDKVEDHVYVLYSYSGDLVTLKIHRFSLEFPNEVEDQAMGSDYEWKNPIGIALTGDLITIFDPGLDQPIRQFAWGENRERYKRGYRYTVASFTPDIIPDLEIWYAANLETTVPGSPTPVNPTDNSLVSKLTDQSGNGLDATQGNDNYKPTYQTNEVNGKPCWRFNGVDNYLRAVNTTIDRQNFTLFCVHKPTAKVPTPDPEITHPLFHSASGLNNDNNATYIAWGGPRSTQNGRIWQSQEEHFFGDTDYALSYQWQISEVVGDDEGWTTYKNGGLIGQHDHENVGNIDVKIWIGTNHNLDVNYRGDVAEIIFYDRPLDDEERTKVEMYLRQKYYINYNPSDPAQVYFGLGDRITYANPVEFHFADQLQAMFVLDNAQTGYLLSWNHWNGDNWSYIRASTFKNVYFEEDGTVGGAMWAIHTHERYGVGMGESFVGLYDLERVSGFCNRPVDMRYYTNDELIYAAAYQINYLLAANKKFSQVVREFLTCFNGYLFYSGGIIKVKVDRDNGITEFDDGLDEILEGTFEFWEIAREDRWNKVRVEVTDERNDYKPLPVSATAEWERDLFGETRLTTIQAEGVTRPRQGVLIAVNSLLGQTMRRFSCKYRVGPQGLRREVGDVGLVTHPHPGWVKKKFMIVAISETEDDELELTMMEHVPNIHTAVTYPLQQPQLTLDLAPGTEGSFDDVHQAVRVRILEDTLDGRAFLLASKPTDSGPWKHLRWYGKWISGSNPGSQFYPGTIPFNTTQHTAFFITANFTASALLKDPMTTTQDFLNLTAVSADPPETNFDLIVYNPSIPANQFAGQYERMQGALYNEENKKVTLDTGGRAYADTPAFAHANVDIIVKATYVRHSGAPQVKYQGPPNPVTTMAPDPLTADDDEWYIGFEPSGFGVGPNAISVVVQGGTFGGFNQNFPLYQTWFGSLSGLFLEYEVYYSIAPEGSWQRLRGVVDQTMGFKQTGRISWDVPILNPPWATTQKWREGTASTDFFKAYATSGTTPPNAAARFYLKFVRIKQRGNKTGNLQVSLEGQSAGQAFGKLHPIVYFLKHNAIPFYDTVPAEQGFTLEFKVQPIGHHGQTIDVTQITGYQKTFQNLAGEGA